MTYIGTEGVSYRRPRVPTHGVPSWSTFDLVENTRSESSVYHSEDSMRRSTSSVFLGVSKFPSSSLKWRTIVSQLKDLFVYYDLYNDTETSRTINPGVGVEGWFRFHSGNLWER